METPWKSFAVGLLSILAIGAAASSIARAEEAPPTGWSDTAELSYVVTAGNSEASTLGFKNTAVRRWTSALFTLKAGGIRVETTSTSRTAIAPNPADLNTFSVFETDTKSTTAENYFLNGRYDRNVTDRMFWYAGAGWDRNRFAGIQNRYLVEGGVGNIWHDRTDLSFRTAYGLTFTHQEDVIENPLADDTFLGARFSWAYLHKFGSNTTYENLLVLDANLDETDDWRGDMINSVAVSMSERLALKVSLQWLYDNEPSLVGVPLESPAGTPTGQFRNVPLDELDTVFTASLVVNF